MFSRFSPIHRHEHGADRVVGGTVLAHQYNDDETYEMTLQDKEHIVLLVLKLAEPTRDRFVVKSCNCQDPGYRALYPGDILRSCHSTTKSGKKSLKEMQKIKFPKVEMLRMMEQSVDLTLSFINMHEQQGEKLGHGGYQKMAQPQGNKWSDHALRAHEEEEEQKDRRMKHFMHQHREEETTTIGSTTTTTASSSSLLKLNKRADLKIDDHRPHSKLLQQQEEHRIEVLHPPFPYRLS
jgi:hypothetical protein